MLISSGNFINIKQEPLDIPPETEDNLDEYEENEINIKAEPPDSPLYEDQEMLGGVYEDEEQVSQENVQEEENTENLQVSPMWQITNIKFEPDVHPVHPTMYVSKDQLPIEFNQDSDDEPIPDPEPEDEPSATSATSRLKRTHGTSQSADGNC